MLNDNSVLKSGENTLWILALQYLFLFYYLSYSNTLLNNDLILIASFAILVYKVFQKLINKEKKSVCFWLACAASLWSFVASILNGSGLGSAVTQTTLLISIVLFVEAKLTAAQRKKVLYRMAVILLIIIAIFSKKIGLNMRYYPILSYFPEELSINPNCIAILSFFIFVLVFELIERMSAKDGYKRLMQIGVSLIMLYYIYSTAARTSLLATVLCIVLLFAFKYFKFFTKVITNRLFLIGLLGTFAIVFMYIGLYKSGFLVGDVIFGKTFYTGRQIIWENALELVKESPLIGFSNKISFEMGAAAFLSAHNSLLAILCHFGIPGVISTVAVLSMAFNKIDLQRYKFIISAIFATLFIMCFETVITDWSLILPFCLLFIQQKNEGELV